MQYIDKKVKQMNNTENQRKKSIFTYIPYLLVSLFILVVISISIPGQDDQSVCCCNPDGSGGEIKPRSVCDEQGYNISEGTSEIDCDIVCQNITAQPPPIYTDLGCQDPDYEVQLEIEISYPKGDRGVKLNWDSDCEAEYYTLERKCIAGRYGCRPSGWIPLNITQSTSYFDAAAMWDTNYTYKVTGYYNVQDDDFESQVNAHLGNLECWYRYDLDEFCIQQSTYNRYIDLLTSEDTGFREDSFDTNVEAEFGDMFNRGYMCDDNNRLHNLLNCTQIGGYDSCDEVAGPRGQCSCVTKDGKAECSARTDCENENADPFALYFQRDEDWCIGPYYNRTFCFLDISATTVDKCYSCDPRMDCYDYKSKDACMTDNCGFGYCAWLDIMPELNIGVCKNEFMPNCRFCNESGTQNVTNIEAYNQIYGQCTPEKATALSTDDYSCYFDGDAIRYCQETVCMDYRDINTCKSHDPCSINSCRWYAEEEACYKDADNTYAPGTNWMDCSHIISENNLQLEDLQVDEDFRECQLDYFVPIMKLSLSDFKRHLPRKIQVQVIDQSTPVIGERVITGYAKAGYKLYICLGTGDSCGNPLSNPPDQDNYMEITQDVLDITNLNFTEEGNPITYFYTLNEGENTLQYYARDPSNNIQDVQSITFNASENATGPEIAMINITPGREIDNIFYSNSISPKIRVTFIQKPKEITRKDIYVEGYKQPIVVDFAWVEDNVAEFEFGQSFGNLNYSLVINAIAGNNIAMDDNYYINFTIDTIPPVLQSVYPGQDEVVDRSSSIKIKAGYNEKVTLSMFDINGLDYAANFSTRDNSTFETSSRIYFNDGTKNLHIEAEDYALNKAVNLSRFIMNKVKEVNISLIKPTWGVSSHYFFDIVLNTDNDAECSFYFSLSPPAQIADSFYDQNRFPVTGQAVHRLDRFSLIPQDDKDEYPFYVRCDDGYYDPTYRLFNLRVDDEPFEILEAIADPGIIIDNDLNTTLMILASEPVTCKYDSEWRLNYSLLSYPFDTQLSETDFKIQKRKEIHIDSEETRNYTYYVACMDKAEFVSNLTQINFSVDLNAEFLINIDRQETGTSETSIPLHIETTKKAKCSWGLSKNTISNYIEPYGLNEFKRVHQGTASNLILGKNTLYFSCIDMAGTYSDIVSIDVFYDNTPPDLLFVNDTSTYVLPEYTCMTDRLRVKWLGEDPESGISGYTYKIYDQQMDNITSPVFTIWGSDPAGGNEWIWINNLDLTPSFTYHFDVFADNGVLHQSSTESSDGVTALCKPPPECGDAIIDPGEQCDIEGPVFGLIDECTDFTGFTGGLLKCSDECFLDTSKCEKPPSCGNGVLDPGEQCDKNGPVLGEINDCKDYSEFSGGIIKCTNVCQLDTSGCTPAAKCGNGVIDVGEECDGDDLGPVSENCADYHPALFTYGKIRCKDCYLDTLECEGVPGECGDAVLNPGESCDHNGPVLGAVKECIEFPNFIGGNLSCNTYCELDTGECTPEPLCGNGRVDKGELCDNNNFGSLYDKSCISYSPIYFDGESLSCDECSINTLACSAAPTCGNGVIDLDETCEGTNFSGVESADCAAYSADFISGNITCNKCQISTSGCIKNGDRECRNTRDSCCNTSLDGVCDVECLTGEDPDCGECTSAEGDCCYPISDDICDKDCLEFRDPDCMDMDCHLIGECGIGENCTDNSECITRYCDNGICAASSCTDGIQNGRETSIDCGGECSPCSKGSACEKDSDCETGNCEYGICTDLDTCKDELLTLSNKETDVDCGGEICINRCGGGMSCIEDFDCETGLKCMDDRCIPCLDNDFDCDGILNDKDDDIDGDGLKNWEDPDDDNDGLCDTENGLINDPGICSGDDDDDNSNGILDPDDKDPDNDLDNDGIENHLDDDIDGDGIPNDEDEDDDNDGIPDRLDDDDDNDGLLDRKEDDDNDGVSNDWESEYGLDPNDPDTDGDGTRDGDEDWDDDDLNNSGEEDEGTDPNNSDTDGDGWEDGTEVNKFTDPLDPDDYPKSYVWAYLLVLILILVLIGGGYYASLQYPVEISGLIETVKGFASTNLGFMIGMPKLPVPRIPEKALPRRPVQGVPTRQEIIRRRREEALKKAEEKAKLIAERPEEIKKLKDVIKPEAKEKGKKDEWITLGEEKPKRSKVSRIFEKLEKVPEKKAGEEIKKEIKLKKQIKPEKKAITKEKKDIFGELGKLIGARKPKDVIYSLKEIAEGRKISKAKLTAMLDNIVKEGKLTKGNISKIIVHLIDKGKVSKSDAKDAILSIAGKGTIPKKDADEIISKLGR